MQSDYLTHREKINFHALMVWATLSALAGTLVGWAVSVLWLVP